MQIEWITFIMFGSLLAALITGLPITYAVGMSSMICAFLLWGPNSLFGLVSSVIGTMNNWTLLAVPLFTFMSIYLFETGMVEDLYDTFYRFTGRIRGGLALCSVIVGAIMGAMTGVVAGTVIALTTIALPQMNKYKYDKNISMGAILSGGTLGQLIPPSVCMIIYGTMTGTSVGGLFAGGLSSGLLLTAIFCIYILIRCYMNKNLCPTMPESEQAPFWDNVRHLKKVFWPCVLVLAVLGTIFSGAATPTEAAAVGCTGAIVVSLFKRRCTFAAIFKTSQETLKMISMVGFVIFPAMFFGQVFTGLGGKQLVINMTSNIPFGATGAITVMMMIVFFLGMFLDTTAIVVICAPLFAPIIQMHRVDPLWFGILFMVCIQTAYLTPPFGFSMFYLKAAAPGVKLVDVYWAAIPFLVCQIVGLVLCYAFPFLAMWGVWLFLG